MTNRRGLSRAEVAVMVAIIVFIAAFALPNIRSARLAANEENARELLGRVAAANALYFRKYQQYAPKIDNLYRGEYLTDRAIEHAQVAFGTPHEGYFYSYVVDRTQMHYLCFALPAFYKVSGRFAYVVNELDDIHGRDIHAAKELDRNEMIDRFVNYDFTVAGIDGRLSPWRTTSKGVLLGRLENEYWLPLGLEVEDD